MEEKIGAPPYEQIIRLQDLIDLAAAQADTVAKLCWEPGKLDECGCNQCDAMRTLLTTLGRRS